MASAQDPSRAPSTSPDEYDIEDGHDALLAELLDSIQARRVQHAVPRTRLSADVQSAAELVELSSQDPNKDLCVANLVDDTYTVPRVTPTQDESQPRDAPDPPDPAQEDTRSPLERFRTAPKKPLSVTDLVSPAWCELQYWYSLVKFGRVRKTPAMKRGSSVHKKLEEQVHVAVPVDVQTKEDYWGLRLWNIIQSLRTLRATGLTRELELWGTVDGQVINGVVDELSYKCPDPALEARLEAAEGKAETEAPQVPSDQTTLSEYFSSQNGDETPSRSSGARKDQKIYITDVKTRGAASTPRGASLRPTTIQLMLYRTLLVSLATNAVDSETVFNRYGLKSADPFSDTLIRQLSAHDSPTAGRDDDDELASLEADADTVAELLGHNSLAQLWQLMMREFGLTFPRGEASIGKVLTAEFRRADDGSVLGTRTFAHDGAGLRGYVDEEMRWWRGERAARGVDVDEAFKCRICEFAGSCSWRIGKMDESVQKSRARRRSALASTG